MSFDPLYALPLASALIYSFAAILFKQAVEEGGPLRVHVITNWVWLVCFTPLVFIHSGPVHWAILPFALLAGLFYFMGAALNTFAARLGAVSVVTPILGAKVVFVALFASLLLNDVIPLKWWIGAALCAVAIFILNPPRKNALFGDWRPVCLALGSCTSFAFADVVTQGWVNQMGIPLFVFSSSLLCTTLSTGMMPFFKSPLSTLSKSCLKKTIAAAVLMASQFLMLVYFFAKAGSATSGNILYSSRALWTVILVWLVGSWFGNREADAGRGALVTRLLGSCILLVAIGIILY